MKKGRGTTGEKTIGNARLGGLDNTIEIILWAIERRLPLTVEAIRERWNVDRATAYRWLAPLANAQERMRPVIFPRAAQLPPARCRALDVEVRAL